jgi:hypothetical protein
VERTFNLHVPFNVFLTLAARCLRRDALYLCSALLGLMLGGCDSPAWGRSRAHPHMHLALLHLSTGRQYGPTDQADTQKREWHIDQNLLLQ